MAAAGCRGSEPGRGNDTASGLPSPPPPAVTGRPAPITWDTTAGFYFAIPTDRPAQALLIDARYAASSELDTLQVDTAAVQGLSFDLLAAGEVVGAARVAAFARGAAEGCDGWPLVELAPAPATGALGDWKVAFPAERVRTVVFDSLPSLPSGDSTRRVVAVARAASLAEGDTAAAFHGRPFVVRQANRIVFGEHEVLVAEVLRSVQQEANPQQEQLLLVLERADSLEGGYAPRYHERTIALEEAIESVEVLAGLRPIRAGTPTLLLRRESEDGMSFVLLQRRSNGTWFVRWRSAVASC